MKLKFSFSHFSTFAKALLVLVLLSSLYYCKKDSEVNQNNIAKPSEQSTFTPVQNAAINAAKTWFESEQQKSQVAAQGQINIKSIEPIWNSALVTNNSVEVNYIIDKQISIPSMYENGLSHQGRSRLMIFNKGASKVSNIWNFMPSDKFKGNVKTITSAIMSLRALMV